MEVRGGGGGDWRRKEVEVEERGGGDNDNGLSNSPPLANHLLPNRQLPLLLNMRAKKGDLSDGMLPQTDHQCKKNW